MQHLIKICQELAKQGKTPSIGLVKARAAKGTPLPEIINAVQRWKDYPEALENDCDQVSPEKISASDSESASIPFLENRVEEMLMLIQKLEARISALEKGIKE